MDKKTLNTIKQFLSTGPTRIDNTLKQYSNHPFILKLHEEAVAEYKKYGMPKELEELIAKNMAGK